MSPTERIDHERVEQLIHEEVNQVRVERGLHSLSHDEELAFIARSHSRRMAGRDFVGHETPSGETIRDRYERFGYDSPRGGGENIARSYYGIEYRREDGSVARHDQLADLAESVVDGWLNSPGHRENLLAGRWRTEGIGVWLNQGSTVFITQNFA